MFYSKLAKISKNFPKSMENYHFKQNLSKFLSSFYGKAFNIERNPGYTNNFYIAIREKMFSDYEFRIISLVARSGRIPGVEIISTSKCASCRRRKRERTAGAGAGGRMSQPLPSKYDLETICPLP